MSSTITTLTVSPAIEALINEKVMSGRYADANEVIGAALELLDYQEKLDRLRAKLAIGFDEIERGESVLYTPELMKQLMREAQEDDRNRVPIDESVTP